MKVTVYCYLLLIISLNVFSCKSLKNTFKSLVDDDEIATITSDNENELVEAIRILNKNGGTIYIDTPIINVRNATLTISGTVSGGIIGIRQATGEYPRITFVESTKNRALSGLAVFGSNKFLEYLIFEHSLTFGVEIYGDNNILDHVISRYNSGSGFLIFGDFNNLNYCSI